MVGDSSTYLSYFLPIGDVQLHLKEILGEDAKAPVSFGGRDQITVHVHC